MSTAMLFIIIGRRHHLIIITHHLDSFLPRMIKKAHNERPPPYLSSRPLIYMERQQGVGLSRPEVKATLQGLHKPGFFSYSSFSRRTLGFLPPPVLVNKPELKHLFVFLWKWWSILNQAVCLSTDPTPLLLTLPLPP